MVDALVVPAPAKLNLRLRIVGRRQDGMHLLDGESVLIDLCDTVTLTPRTDGRIVRAWQNPQVTDEVDLACQAARRMQAYAKQTAGVDIHIDKKIPIGGGLGGASSDAAAVLLGLNRLWQLQLPQVALITIAASLGADVAFFIVGRTARIGGVGESVEVIKAPINSYLLVFPTVIAHTAAVYAQFQQLTLAEKIRKIPLSLDKSYNDLTPAAVHLYPEIAEVATELCAVAKEARMSGSGATVFAVFVDEQDARRAQLKLPNGRLSAVVRGIAAHPFLSGE